MQLGKPLPNVTEQLGQSRLFGQLFRQASGLFEHLQQVFFFARSGL